MSDRRALSGYLAAALQRPSSWRRDAPHMPDTGRPLHGLQGHAVVVVATSWKWGCMELLVPPAAAVGTLHLWPPPRDDARIGPCGGHGAVCNWLPRHCDEANMIPNLRPNVRQKIGRTGRI